MSIYYESKTVLQNGSRTVPRNRSKCERGIINPIYVHGNWPTGNRTSFSNYMQASNADLRLEEEGSLPTALFAFGDQGLMVAASETICIFKKKKYIYI